MKTIARSEVARGQRSATRPRRSFGVWSDKGSKIFKIVNKLRAGVVWANTYNKFDPTSPFGGYKESGFGREGGVHGLVAYMQLN
jgi:aldehyde dehydrogenase (NAD+)